MEDVARTMLNQKVVGFMAYVSRAPAAIIAETYFPRLAMWLISPSSNHLLAHLNKNMNDLSTSC